MRNSELPTQDWTLADLPVGVPARVVAIGPECGLDLANHGLRPGVAVEVSGDAPLHGPRIVHLGPTRLALARVVAGAVSVRPEVDAG